MAKTKATSTRSPFGFVPGDVARKDDFTAVHEMQNAARGDLPHNLLTLQGDAQNWGGSSELSPAGAGGILWPATGTDEVYEAMVYIDPDLVQLAIKTKATLPGGATGSVVVTIGSTSTTHAHSAGGSSTVTSTLNTSATGTGWQLVTVDLRRDTGDPSTGYLERARIRSVPIAASALGDPV